MSYGMAGGGLTPDDLNRGSRDHGIRERAQEWFRAKSGEIAALAGREATSQERSIPRLMVALELAGEMYGDVRKEFGHEAAQEILRQGLGLLGGILRRNGEEVHMRVSVEFAKVSNPAAAAAAPLKEGPAAAPPGAEGRCECALDQDGRCAECLGTFRTYFAKASEMIEVIRGANLMQCRLCRQCVGRHMDAALADFVRTSLAGLDPEHAEEALKMLFMSSQTIRAMPMPLTTRAWDEVCRARGGRDAP